ncbi:uncharacterized protein DFL_000437 [Arthrobotrys flagrans]|uniref:Uncharacterized protein n=1 Tax=Arthrobotrys flagrans TaxID=97331 RepID=A0A437ADS4_ARTFL|nr:hypothetical protein DFL_000437 [Arthrobotrys flagrans]
MRPKLAISCFLESIHTHAAACTPTLRGPNLVPRPIQLLWIKALWDDDDQQQLIKSYQCIPSTSDDYEAFTKSGTNTTSTTSESANSGASATTEVVDVASETATNTPGASSSHIEARLAGALAGAGFVLIVLYI